MEQIDINCDMGERELVNGHNPDEPLMPFITSGNISCGAHAGTPASIKDTVRLALKNGVRLGAHPSYPDRKQFGRKRLKIKDDELLDSIKKQVSLLREIVHSLGGELSYVKAHGALYHRLTEDKTFAENYLNAIVEFCPNPVFYGMESSMLQQVVKSRKFTFCNEVFIDRAYLTAEKLIPRGKRGAVIDQPEVLKGQLQNIINGKIMTQEGIVNCNAQTLCIHSDNPSAINLAKIAQQFLINSKVKIQSFGSYA